MQFLCDWLCFYYNYWCFFFPLLVCVFCGCATINRVLCRSLAQGACVCVCWDIADETDFIVVGKSMTEVYCLFLDDSFFFLLLCGCMYVDLYVCVRVLARALRGVVLLLTTLSTTFIQKGVLLFFFFLALPDKIFGFGRRFERRRTHAFLFYRLKLLHSNISKKNTHTASRSEKKKAELQS